MGAAALPTQASRTLGSAVVALSLVVSVAACGSNPAASPSLPAIGRTPTAVPTAPGTADAPSAALAVTAENLTYSPTTLDGPAGAPLTITLANRDDGVPHNIVIRAGLPANDVAPSGPDLFAGEIFVGRDIRAYGVPALPAGVYTFSCAVHPNMVGTLRLR